jgi:hypothetical protein
MNLYELERDMDQKWDALCRWKHLGRATHELDRMYDKYLEALNRYIAALQTATLEEKRVNSYRNRKIHSETEEN